jgi:hypothetical protein
LWNECKNRIKPAIFVSNALVSVKNTPISDTFFHRRETATADCPRPPPPDEMRDYPEINA